MKQEKIVIFGNGSMARALYAYLREDNEVCAFTVDSSILDSTELIGLPVVAFDNIEKTFCPSEYKMIVAVGYVEMNQIRQQKIKQAKIKGYQLISYCHPTVVLDDSVILGENCILLEYATVHAYSKIGDGVFISSNTNLGHDVVVESGCWINAGVCVGGGTLLGKNVFLGMNSTIGHQIKIADNTFIGANAFVAKNTLPGEVYLSPQGEKFRMTSENFLKLYPI